MINVLLIDDDEDEYLIFSAAVQYFKEPIRCIYAHSAEQAFVILEHLRPKAIFVDMNMPRINGIDCIKKLNEANKGNAPMVVIYSTHMDNALCDRAKKAGATDCLKKTSSILSLVEKLAQFLSVA